VKPKGKTLNFFPCLKIGFGFMPLFYEFSLKRITFLKVGVILISWEFDGVKREFEKDF